VVSKEANVVMLLFFRQKFPFLSSAAELISNVLLLTCYK
jgi:hypothetical protein